VNDGADAGKCSSSSSRVFCTKRRLPTTALIYRMKSCANNCPSADDENEEEEEEEDEDEDEQEEEVEEDDV